MLSTDLDNFGDFLWKQDLLISNIPLGSEDLLKVLWKSFRYYEVPSNRNSSGILWIGGIIYIFYGKKIYYRSSMETRLSDDM